MGWDTSSQDLKAKAYKTGIDAFHKKDWSNAEYWLESVYQEAPDFEAVGKYYFYTVGFLAYQERHWQKARENLQRVYNQDPEFEDCIYILEQIKERQTAAACFEQALMLLGEQKHIEPKAQRWDEIISKLEEAKQLDPDHEKVSNELEQVTILRNACSQFIASLSDLQNREFRDAFDKLNGIDDRYKAFCSDWASKHEEAIKGEQLQELYEEGQKARYDQDWTRAVRYFQELCNKDVENIYPEATRLLDDVRDLESKVKPEIPANPNENPLWKDGVFWTAVGSIATIIALLVAMGLVPPINNGTPTPDKITIGTANGIATDTAVANATEVAIVTMPATAEPYPTETAIAEATLTAIANATQTATDVEKSAATAANETAVVERNATGTAQAMERATATATREAPTSTPPPSVSDAIVASLNGLNLRSGPGTNYDVIGNLENGDILDILGRSADKEWIKVIPGNPGIEGWVSAGLTQINIDLDDVPVVIPPPTPTSMPTQKPTPPFLTYSPPTLTGPDNGSGAFATFPPLKWTWEGELAEDEFFEVRVWHEDLPYHAALGWVKQPNFDYNVSGERPGKYLWTVLIVKGKKSKQKDWTLQPWWPYPMWEGDLVQELSEESEPRFFFFTPSNSSHGGDNSGGPLSHPDPPSCPSPPC